MTLSAVHWDPKDEDFRTALAYHYVRSVNEARRCKEEQPVGANFYNEKVRTIIDQMSDEELLGRGRSLVGSVNRLAWRMEEAYPQLKAYHYRFRRKGVECFSPPRQEEPTVAKSAPKKGKIIEMPEEKVEGRVPVSSREASMLAFLYPPEATGSDNVDFTVTELREVANRNLGEAEKMVARRVFRNRVIHAIHQVVPPLDENSLWDVTTHYANPFQGDIASAAVFVSNGGLFAAHVRELTRAIQAYEALSPEGGDDESMSLDRLRGLYLLRFGVLNQAIGSIDLLGQTLGISGASKAPELSERDQSIINPLHLPLGALSEVATPRSAIP